MTNYQMNGYKKILIAGGLKENGIVIGNTFDKYNSGNPIIQKLMKGYETSLNELVSIANPLSIHEVGCGEGYWSLKWLESGIQTVGSDFSEIIIELAQKNAVDRNLSPSNFTVRDIYELKENGDTANLVVCCNVLEHLEYPMEALQVLRRISNPYLIICVPKEPVWRFLNVIRGKYLFSLGNTPGHIQHWSERGIINLVSEYFNIVKVNTPFPWTMILCKVNRSL